MKIESDRDDVKIKVFVDHQLFGEQVSGGAVQLLVHTAVWDV